MHRDMSLLVLFLCWKMCANPNGLSIGDLKKELGNASLPPADIFEEIMIHLERRLLIVRKIPKIGFLQDKQFIELTRSGLEFISTYYSLGETDACR